MDADRPAAGQLLNPGAPTKPRPAATVILLRDGEPGLEVLLVQRNPRARFMAGAWVFPGGAVDPSDRAGDGDGTGHRATRAAGLRELSEEARVTLRGPDALVPFSRWITPPEFKIRFDTWFFLALAPGGIEPSVDGGEVVAWRWYAPERALAAARAGEILLVFPTIKHLEQLAAFPTATTLLEHARNREIESVAPRVLGSGETARIVLPGDAGYRRG